MSAPATAVIPRVLAVGMNAVLQKTLLLPHLRVGHVNRARQMLLTAGGKGIHCARAANLHTPGSTTVAHFLGGANGDFVDRQLRAQQIPQLTVRIAGETRVCTTLLDEATGVMTELIDPSPPITPAERDEMVGRLVAALPGLAGLALNGTLPAGIAPELYARLARAKGGALLLLDAYKDVADVLATRQVDILKINREELRELTGEPDSDRAAATARARFGVPVIAVTDGPHPARLYADGRTWALTLPPLPDLKNPIGAGDTVAAVMLLERLAGADAVEAFALGLAAASASCRALEGARYTLPAMRELRARLTIAACD